MLLNEVNAALGRHDRPLLAHLPGIFGADVTVVSSFKELDPYAEHRTADQAAPSLMNWAPPAASAGDEIIVYWSERLLNLAGVFEQLTATGLPVRVVAPGARPEHTAKFPRLVFETRPLHFSEITQRARLVISNAPAGFVSAAMLAGLPQAVLPYDVQKELIGQAIASLGVGISDSIARIDWSAWRQRIERLYTESGPRRLAVSLAGELGPRMGRNPAEICTSALARFV